MGRAAAGQEQAAQLLTSMGSSLLSPSTANLEGCLGSWVKSGLLIITGCSGGPISSVLAAAQKALRA